VFANQALTVAWKSDATFASARATNPTGTITLTNLSNGDTTALNVEASTFTAAASEYFTFNV